LPESSFVPLFRSKSTALLFSLLGGEFGIFMLYKLGRRDGRYWLSLPGASSIIGSFLVRFLLLQAVLGTSLLQGRHPFEMGGVGWTAAHILGHSALIASVFLLKFENITWSELQLQTLSCGVVTVWWFAFGLLLYNVKSGYKGSFFSTLTGVQFSKLQFDAGDDATRADVFNEHRALWIAYKQEIVAWLAGGWTGWENVKPDWFTADWKEKFPDDMLPDLKGGGEEEGGVWGRLQRR